MGIVSELKNRGIEVSKTDSFYRGYYTTKKGVSVSRREHECEKGIYFLETEKGKIFPCNNQVIYILSGTEYEGIVKTKEEAEELAREGKIYSLISSELYSEYYEFQADRDLESCFKYGYSYRSRTYIESVMKNIGLMQYTDASNGSGCEEGKPTKFDIVRIYSLFVNSEDTEVGKLDQKLWIAQTCHQIAIDDYAVIKMYFNHMPSESDIRTSFAIRKFERNPIEVFKCWECGHLVHWLELDGDISKKYEMAEECYCGC